MAERTRDPSPSPETQLPLPPATFHILLSLADGERHGYAIMREVAERTGGATRLCAGTLYGALKRLLDGGLVAEGGERADPAMGTDAGTEAGEAGAERRRYYRLTPFGRLVARAEARRLDDLVRAARQKRLLGLEPA